jgi:hypothetical protein
MNATKISFLTSTDDTNVNAIDRLADCSSMEIKSITEKNNLLDALIDKEDEMHHQRLAKQLPIALGTLPCKQRYAVLSY